MGATGSRDTANLTARKYDVKDVISLLDVNRYPLLAILTNAGKDPVSKQGKAIKKMETTDSEFKWYEDEFQSRTATTTTGQTGKDISTAIASVVLASGEGVRFAIGDVIKFPATKYTFKVTNVSTDTLSLSAELGGATGTVDLSSLPVWIIGNSNQEGASLRTIKGTTPVEHVGYCQIFRTPFGVTETSRNTQTLIRENDFDFQRRKKGIEHYIDIERAFWFSKKAKVTSGTHPERWTEGILNAISTYATANVDTEAEFELWLESAFAHGNTEKYLFAAPAVMSMISGWAKNKLQLMPADKVYGMTIYKYQSVHGTVNIIKNDLFTGTTFGNYAVALDMEAIFYRYLSNRDTKLATNRQAPGDDERVDEYITECGLHFEQESRHAIMSMGSL